MKPVVIWFIIHYLCIHLLSAQNISDTLYQTIEKEPSPINLDELKKEIVYPVELKEKKIGGKVLVRILLDKEGNYEKHLVVKSPDTALTAIVEKVIPRLRCTPCTQQERAIKCWITIPFNFIHEEIIPEKAAPFTWVFPIKSDFVFVSETILKGKKVFLYENPSSKEMMGHSQEVFIHYDDT